MIHLKIGDNSDLWVFVEEHGTWKQLPGHLVARSRLLQGLMRDFDGPQCSTTLPVSIQAFLLWSFGKLGCLEQAADLLNVRSPARCCCSEVHEPRLWDFQ